MARKDEFLQDWISKVELRCYTLERKLSYMEEEIERLRGKGRIGWSGEQVSRSASRKNLSMHVSKSGGQSMGTARH